MRDAGGLDKCGSSGDSEKWSGLGCVWKMVLAGLDNGLDVQSEKTSECLGWHQVFGMPEQPKEWSCHSQIWEDWSGEVAKGDWELHFELFMSQPSRRRVKQAVLFANLGLREEVPVGYMTLRILRTWCRWYRLYSPWVYYKSGMNDVIDISKEGVAS